MFPCVSCHNMIAPDAVIAGVAQCPTCSSVMDVPGRGLWPQPPDTVTVRAHPQGVQLILPWHVQHGPLLVGMVMVPVLVGIMGWMYVNFFHPHSMMLALPLMVVLAYYGLCALVNSTYVLVTPLGVEIEHGPLPTVLPTVRIAAIALGRVSVVSTPSMKRGGRPVYHLVEGMPRKWMLSGWFSEDAVRYVGMVIGLTHPRPNHVSE